MSHDHTEHCASTSRFVAVEVRVNITRKGAEARIRMKPGAACWTELETVAVLRMQPCLFPTAPEEAAEVACLALREAFPGLF